jgi:MFS family permease
MTGSEAAAKEPSSGYRLYVLALLILVYTFNFLDRQILGILAIPIKADLGLSDTQLGLMGGLAFAIVYSTLAVPVAWLADRWSRTWIITIALTTVERLHRRCAGRRAASGSCSCAAWGVGVGEAGGVAPSYSLVA